jgi:transcriptional regulator with XRE-family HTH domain
VAVSTSRIPTRRRRNRQPPGARFRARRIELGLSQEQVAATAGVSQEAVSGVERGHRPGSLELRRKLAAALAADVAEFWPPDD